MPLPKLSPLQSRLAASLIASLVLLMLYFVFSSSHFAYAAEIFSEGGNNHEPILDTPFLEGDDLEVTYLPEFLGVDRGIVGRQASANDATPLTNNVVAKTNVEQGALMSFVFSNTSLFGPKSPETPGLPSETWFSTRDLKDEEEVHEGIIEDLEVFENKDVGDDGEMRLQPRQSNSVRNQTLWITVTTCLQPSPIKNTTVAPPPQLKLYISQSRNNTKPGPKQDAAKQKVIELQQGYAMYVLNATGDVFIGIYGENTTAYKDVWNVQLAASIDSPFHTWQNATDPNLFMVDSDSGSALLVTDNLLSPLTNNSELYENWMNLAPPFVIFASPADDPNLKGLERSYCAWDSFAAMGASTPGKTSPNQIQSGMTSRGVENLPKEQFYVEGLQPGSRYNAVLAMKGNSTSDADGTVGGGGQLFPVMSFATMQDGNCGVIFNLSFCSASAYSVPSNPNNFPDMSSLAAFYDNYTQTYYESFKKVLAQTACETESSAQYSLVRTCQDCEIAYKRWLCSVTIPRCTDFSSEHEWLVPRAMGQPFPNGTFLSDDLKLAIPAAMRNRNSRNPVIDERVVPGPYKEVLPCDDLCYNVVQSCPASMGFKCPLPGAIGFAQSYGVRPLGEAGRVEKSTQITCNYPGAAYFMASGARLGPEWMSMLLGVGVVVMMVMTI